MDIKKYKKKIILVIPKIDRLRHILKSISYRIYSTCITIGISIAVTGNAAFGLSIGLVDFSVKIFTYYIHERIWFRIPFGLQKPRKIHSDINWNPGEDDSSHTQVSFIEFEDKDIRKRVKITKRIIEGTGSHGETEYRAIISYYNKDTKERLSAIYMGNKSEIERKLNIKIA
jgi:uncharacterized membrane protein